MLLNCPNCKTRYLLNSIDLQPNGKLVQCGLCSHQWYKRPSSENGLNTKNSDLNKLGDYKDYERKLPSTHVEVHKASFFNSAIVLILIFLIILLYWYIRNSDKSLMISTIYYLKEFFMYINLLINNIAISVKYLIG